MLIPPSNSAVTDGSNFLFPRTPGTIEDVVTVNVSY